VNEPPFRRIAIVGLGLIGGSIALAAKRRWPAATIVAVDRGGHVLDTALQLRAADAVGQDLSAAADADLVVLAAPVLQNVETIQRLPDHLRAEAVVTDVGSTKRVVCNAAAALPERLTFVGGHPLAGAAVGGLQAARSDLFENRPWILTSECSASPHAVAALETFVSGLGAIPQSMTAEEHDRLLAYISHLPQLAVSALMQVVGDRAGADGLALAGRGLRDTTRLATSPAGTWRDIVLTNGDNIARAIDDLRDALERLKRDDGSLPLDDIFTSAARWKGVLEGT
jgi:prephenate dehydrogenase